MRKGDLSVKKVLFLKFSSLGDVIQACFNAKEIKEAHPHWELTWMVDSVYKSIVEDQPFVDKIIEWNRKRDGNLGFWKILMQVRREKYDILVDMHSTDRSTFFSFFSNIPVRYGEHPLIKFVHNRHDFTGAYNTSFQLADCKSYLFAGDLPQHLQKQFGEKSGRKMIIMSIGASYAKKRWSAERWIELSKLALDASYRLCLVGAGADEAKTAEEIMNALGPENFVNMVDKVSLPELIRVVNYGDVTVSGDTGILHIARALGKPVIGLFGPTLLEKDYMDSLYKVLYSECDNKGCEDWDCSKSCLSTIMADAVFAAVKGVE